MHRNLPVLVCLAVIFIMATAAVILQTTNTQLTTTSTQTTYFTSTIPQQTFSNNAIKHVIIIVLENAEYSSVIGNSGAPYENGLAQDYALASNYLAVAHPSEPNYIAMIAGSTLNVTNDGAVSQNRRSATNIVDLFRAKGISWKAYEESMPTACDINSSTDGLYTTKHNPFVYMTDITGNSTYCSSHVVNLTQFYADLAGDRLPQYAFITPNVKHDGHDTGVAAADRWLSTFLPIIINSNSFSSSVLFLTYDEGTTNTGGGGHIATIVIGPNSIVRPGFSTSVAYSHYSLLATIESIYGLGNLGRKDTNATAMYDVFVAPGLQNQ